MNIRPKLIFLQLAVIAGFIIALSVIFFYSRSIIKLKDLRIHSVKVLSAAEQIKSRVDNIMTSNVDLFDQKSDIIDSINSVGIIFNQFRDPEILQSLPKENTKALDNLINRWFEIYETHYLLLFIKMDGIIVNPFTEISGNKELIGLRYEILETPSDDVNYEQKLEYLQSRRRSGGQTDPSGKVQPHRDRLGLPPGSGLG